MPVSLITTEAYPYAGRSLKKGERFQASESDARLLKLLGRAVDADPESPPKRQYRRRDLKAER